MEKYVVSPELAEKLKASGYPQTPQHFYYHDGMLMYNVNKYELSGQAVAAPLSDELLEQLFDALTLTIRSYESAMKTVVIEAAAVRGHSATSAVGKPADALAELWLWCKEEGIRR